jgi:hypothetical protein
MRKIKEGQTILTIRRPGGAIETVDVYSRFGHITDATFNRIKTETAKAGRGTVLSYENIDSIYELDEKDLALKKYCESYDKVNNMMTLNRMTY